MLLLVALAGALAVNSPLLLMCDFGRGKQKAKLTDIAADESHCWGLFCCAVKRTSCRHGLMCGLASIMRPLPSDRLLPCGRLMPSTKNVMVTFA